MVALDPGDLGADDRTRQQRILAGILENHGLRADRG